MNLYCLYIALCCVVVGLIQRGLGYQAGFRDGRKSMEVDLQATTKLRQHGDN